MCSSDLCRHAPQNYDGAPVGVGLFSLAERLLFEDVAEINARAGQPMTGSVTKGGIPFDGSIGGDLEIHLGGRDGARTAPEFVPVPTMKALRIRTANSALEALDMGVAYYRDRQALPPADEFLGRVCVVNVQGKKGEMVRVVRRGEKTGRFNLYEIGRAHV